MARQGAAPKDRKGRAAAREPAARELAAREPVADRGPLELDRLIHERLRLGIVSAGFLLRNFKYAVLLIFIFAAVITPDGNPVTQLMVGGPMVVLYFLGIGAAWVFGKSKKSDPEE